MEPVPREVPAAAPPGGQGVELLEAAGVAALLLDRQGRVAAVTQPAVARWGLEPVRVVGVAALALGIRPEARSTVVLPAGTRRVRLDVQCRPLPDGGAVAFLAEPDKGTAVLVQSLAQCLRPAFFAVDGEGRIQVWGNGAAHLLGHPPGTLEGTRVEDLLVADEAPNGAAGAAAGHAPSVAGEAAGPPEAGGILADGLEGRLLTLRHADGHPVMVQVSTVALGGADGPGRGKTILVVCSDTQELQDAQDLQYMREREELQRLAASLERENQAIARANHLKTHFLANMSHELRTPLNAILGFTKLLKGERAGGLNAKQMHYVNRVLEGGEHLLSLINELLDMARIEGGEMDLHFEEVDVVRLAQETLDAVSPLASPKGLALHFASTQPERTAVTDPVRFKQILFNLLNNAVKFTPEDGAITLRIQERDAQHLRVEVEDTGIGIPTDRLMEVFEDFAQLESPLSKSNPGVGLGLAIVRRIVEAMGGAVGVESEVGHGSTFWVDLPYNPPPGRRRSAGFDRKPSPGNTHAPPGEMSA